VVVHGGGGGGGGFLGVLFPNSLATTIFTVRVPTFSCCDSLSPPLSLVQGATKRRMLPYDDDYYRSTPVRVELPVGCTTLRRGGIPRRDSTGVPTLPVVNHRIQCFRTIPWM
jgi:hypothetical protein